MTTEHQDEHEERPEEGHAGGGEELGASDFASLPVEEQVTALSEALEEAQREAAQNLDGVLRAQAEMANFRKRTDDDRIANAKYANSRLISSFLPVIAELDLAIAHASRNESGGGPSDSWLEGVMLIQRKLNGVLESEGVTAIETDGVMFDPTEHEALGTAESAEHPPGHVSQTIRPGFKLHGRVIQPAQVLVATAPQEPDA